MSFTCTSRYRFQSIHLLRKSQNRTFLNNILPLPPIQRLHASRTLPHSSKIIYEIIAGVPAYASFLPGCLQSTVTKWSAPDSQWGRRWPSEALIEVGWGDLVRETFRSQIYCVPGEVVESVGGIAQTRLNAEDIKHHLNDDDIASPTVFDEQRKSHHPNGGDDHGAIRSLVSRWSLEKLATQQTKVSLDIEYQFTNPIYSSLSAAVSDKVADRMIEAFEKRVQEELLRNAKETKTEIEASI